MMQIEIELIVLNGNFGRDLLGNDIKKKLDLKEHPDQGVYVQSKCL